MRFTFFGGKGGVGKTTCAAAAAVRASRGGARVLVVSTDPAHSLGDALEARLGPEPTRVGKLAAVQLDADRALTRWLRGRERAFRTIAERGTYLDDEDVDELLSLSLPGVDELVGLVELLRLSQGDTYDEVIVDTAPTGHTLRLLEMPATLARLAQVLDDMHAKHRFLKASLGGSAAPDFADAAIAEIEREAASIRAMLASAAFTWVTLPEKLPVDESIAGAAAIEERGVRVATVVVNRVMAAPARACPLCSARAEAERESLARIAQAFAGKRLLIVPSAPAEPRGRAALAALADDARPLRVPREPRPAPSPRTSRPGARAELDVPAGAELVLFGGKGGVGKTTLAAAAALDWAAREPSRRVLLLSTDPAHSLGHAFDEPIGDRPKRVRGAPPNLAVRELDAKAAFESLRARYRASIDELFASIFRGRMDAAFDRAVMEDLLDLAPPGLDELFALVTLIEAKERYDLVVVDTAPTGHTLRLLELPEHALAWVHAIMQILLKYRDVVGLGELASDLTELAKNLRAFTKLLADPARTAFVPVTRAESLPLLETERLVAALRRRRVPLGGIVCNAVVDAVCEICASTAGAQARTLRARRPMIHAPAVFPPPRGVAALRAFRAAWRHTAR